jgi:hypothetical protein
VVEVVDAVDAVSQKLAHLVLPAQMVPMVKMVLPVKLVTTDKMAQLLLLNLKSIGASNVLNLQLVLLVIQDLKVHPVMLVPQVPLLTVVHADPLAHLDLLDLPDKQEPQEMQELQAPLELLTTFLAPKDPLDPQAQMDNPDLLDPLVPMDNPVNLEVKAHPEMLDPMEPQETQVEMEKMAQMEKLVLVAHAITALPHVLPPDIKPFNNHLWEADLLLKAWLPLVESTKSLSSFFLFFLLYLVIVIFGETKLKQKK